MKTWKYITMGGLLLGLSLPVLAADTYTTGFEEGSWEGRIVESVAETLKGKAVWATTKREGEVVTVTVKFDGATGAEKEVWSITPSSLVQTEYNKNGKSVSTYRANARQQGGVRERVFDIHCDDRVTKKCDADIDPNNNWVLSHDIGKFVYIVRGLKDKANPASLGERHHFEFRLIKDKAAATATATKVLQD